MNSSHSYLSRFVLLALALSIVSCGGGSSGGGGSSSSATITSISPRGMVASGTARAIALTGTNFVSGMTVSVTDNLGGAYTVGTVNVQSSSLISTTATIPTAPGVRYVTVAVKSSTGTTLASTTLGVASVSKTLATDIQPIFNTFCTGCHGSSGNLSLSTGTAASNLIETASSGCSSRLRVKAGDPRASSSFLIDKLSNSTPCAGNKMTGSPTAITQAEINTITEWIAGGAN